MAEIRSLPRIATIATLASRTSSLRHMLPTILPQVDHIFIYLDGHSEAPQFLSRLNNATILMKDELHGLKCSSRLLCLKQLRQDSVVICVDDDILYPADYVERLIGLLDRLQGAAIVGVHGRIFVPPYASYVEDAHCFHFARELDRCHHVHELGSGTSAFVSGNFPVDPSAWDRHDMNDLHIAIEAQNRDLPRIAINRTKGWLKPIALRQHDSLWKQTLADHEEQDRRMKMLLSLYRGN
jgi:hypothetical protein